MAKDFLVVNGATLSCSFGTVTSSLTVVSSKAKAGGEFVGVISDLVVGTFGTCSALGPGPCAPVLVYPAQAWSPGCTKNNLNSKACIKKSDTLTCGVGGVITVSNANQTKVQGE